MPLNPVAIAAGATSFSVAISWNRAVSDSVQAIIGKPSPPIVQAVVMTILAITVIKLINTFLDIYEGVSGNKIQPCLKPVSNNPNSKVSIWYPAT